MNKLLDVEKLRDPHESDAKWRLRRKFILASIHVVPADCLQSLSRCFYNVHTLGCTYPRHIMELISEFAAAAGLILLSERHHVPGMLHRRLARRLSFAFQNSEMLQDGYQEEDSGIHIGDDAMTGELCDSSLIEDGNAECGYAFSQKTIESLMCYDIDREYAAIDVEQLDLPCASLTNPAQEQQQRTSVPSQAEADTVIAGSDTNAADTPQDDTYKPQSPKAHRLEEGGDNQEQVRQCVGQNSLYSLDTDHASAHVRKRVTSKPTLKAFIKLLKQRKAARDRLRRNPWLQENIWFRQHDYEAAETLYYSSQLHNTCTQADQSEADDIPSEPETMQQQVVVEQQRKMETWCPVEQDVIPPCCSSSLSSHRPVTLPPLPECVMSQIDEQLKRCSTLCEMGMPELPDGCFQSTVELQGMAEALEDRRG